MIARLRDEGEPAPGGFRQARRRRRNRPPTIPAIVIVLVIAESAVVPVA
ncbi:MULTISPECIES: hypothetical protein [unclassified Streptomyces]|nr:MULTISPECIES: hypothetical protein [unclassified Streptomyces]WSU20485.1 hypothetical protein OG508_05390 [Streptomyces sp. NBC_01108]MCX4790728.1 hypothetical protein [Streptomyces sp. NBC_01221]MCX4793542.1 hypothetical protein [Streptomyces sp. NBC_01242]WSJ34971.1 hypothetical protein OG772_02065 [Streptomyces sp. NBC_01321]WSP61412.1 hypothetical protein OG466_05475 [Streptomyces sp. NBC_01240]